jgi:hypothetical protein
LYDENGEEPQQQKIKEVSCELVMVLSKTLKEANNGNIPSCPPPFD